MKKLIATLSLLGLFLFSLSPCIPQTLAATPSLAVNKHPFSPGSQVVPGNIETPILIFTLSSPNSENTSINKMTVYLTGNGISDVEGIKLIDSNDNVLRTTVGTSFATNSSVAYFSGLNITTTTQPKVYAFVLDIKDQPTANNEIKLDLESIEYTGLTSGEIATDGATTEGAELAYGNVSHDGTAAFTAQTGYSQNFSLSNLLNNNTPENDLLPFSTSLGLNNPGNMNIHLATEKFKILSFNVTADRAMTMSQFEFNITGNGTNSIKNISLHNQTGLIAEGAIANNNVLFSGLAESINQNETKTYDLKVTLNTTGTINNTFQPSLTRIKGTDLVSAVATDQVLNPTLQGSTFTVVQALTTNPPTNNPSLTPNITVSLHSTNPGNKTINHTTLNDILIFKANPNFNTQIKKIEVTATGNASNYLDQAKLLDQNNNVFATTSWINGKANFFLPQNKINANQSWILKLSSTLNSSVPEGSTFTPSLTYLEASDSSTSSIILATGVPLSGSKFTMSSTASSSTNAPINTATATGTNQNQYEEILDSAEETYANPFKDISGQEAKSLRGRAALYLSTHNIIRGYITNVEPFTVEFKGERKLNRAEVVKFVVNSLGYSDATYCNESVFPDVPKGEWYERYVCTAKKLGLIEGYTDGTFKGAQTITKNEFLKIVVEAHKLEKNLSHSYQDTTSSEWYDKYLGAAEKYKLFPTDTTIFNANKVVDRWEAATATYILLTGRTK